MEQPLPEMGRLEEKKVWGKIRSLASDVCSFTFKIGSYYYKTLSICIKER